MFGKIAWREVCKFLSGAFFVSTGVLFYLYYYGVSVPVFGTGLIETPGISAVRAIIHAAFFVVFFSLGFLR